MDPHPTVQQWISQQKRRLAAEQRVDSGVQTDAVPVSLLEQLTSQASGNQDGLRAGFPSQVIRARKEVVQEELLKCHALCRAESRVRRKRLFYQLERIGRKQHLLEAKRELERLEKEVPPGSESPDPPEPPGLHFVSRRHSFSADLLSRLYPQHTPIFR